MMSRRIGGSKYTEENWGQGLNCVRRCKRKPMFFSTCILLIILFRKHKISYNYRYRKRQLKRYERIGYRKQSCERAEYLHSQVLTYSQVLIYTHLLY